MLEDLEDLATDLIRTRHIHITVIIIQGDISQAITDKQKSFYKQFVCKSFLSCTISHLLVGAEIGAYAFLSV